MNLHGMLLLELDDDDDDVVDDDGFRAFKRAFASCRRRSSSAISVSISSCDAISGECCGRVHVEVKIGRLTHHHLGR